MCTINGKHVPFDFYLQSTLLLSWVKLLKFHGGRVGWMVDCLVSYLLSACLLVIR